LANRKVIYESRVKKRPARHQWLMPIILATQEAEIRRTAV
jgi:hypothetical protein